MKMCTCEQIWQILTLELQIVYVLFQQEIPEALNVKEIKAKKRKSH